MDSLIDRRYRILAELGSGGMGSVYRVEDLRSAGQVLALKVLASEGDRQRERLLRFRREFRAAAGLDHPNIVRVHEFVAGRVSYYTMEYFEGRSIAAYFGGDEPRPRPEDLNHPDRVRRLFAAVHQILLALTYLHDRQLVHRDLKPENILVRDVAAPGGGGGTTTPLVKLMDFGLVRDLRDTTLLTQPGVVLGTLAYLSPEQATGRAVDGRADLYALGVVLYRLLSGRLPFTTDTVSSILWKHCSQEPEPPHLRNPAVNRALESACLKLLRKEPHERYQTASELLRAVERAGRDSYVLPEEVSRTRVGTTAAGQLFAPRLVGREAELAQLERALERAGAAPGRGSAFLVLGEAGAGKTRLQQELAARARGRGLRLLLGSAEEGDLRPAGALRPVIDELLAMLRARPRDEAAAALGRSGACLLDLRPGGIAAEVVARLDPGPAGPEERARQRPAAVADLLRWALGSGPLVLVVEDLQRADPASIAILDHLLRTLVFATDPARAGLVLVLTGEPDAGDRLAPAAAPGEGRGLPPRPLALTPLGVAEIELLAQSMLGQPATSPACIEALLQASRGLPLWVEEALRLLVDDGVLAGEAGRFRLDRERLLAAARAWLTPDGLRARSEQSWRQRLDGLSADARLLVELAALVPGPADFEHLRRAASGLGEAAAVDAAGEAIRARLLIEGRSEEELVFPHQRLRQLVRAGLDGERRQGLSRDLLAALATAGSEADEPELRAAVHALGSGDEQLLAGHLAAAVARLQALGDPAGAERLAAELRRAQVSGS